MKDLVLACEACGLDASFTAKIGIDSTNVSWCGGRECARVIMANFSRPLDDELSCEDPSLDHDHSYL